MSDAQHHSAERLLQSALTTLPPVGHAEDAVGAWSVYRRDNGDAVLLESGLPKEIADAMVADLEAAGDQGCWAQRADAN